MPVDAIASRVITRAATAASVPAEPSAAAADFGASLARLVDGVNGANATANDAVDGMLAGQVDVHDAMIALQKAEHLLQFSVQVRNKLVAAYQDIMRMPV